MKDDLKLLARGSGGIAVTFIELGNMSVVAIWGTDPEFRNVKSEA